MHITSSCRPYSKDSLRTASSTSCPICNQRCFFVRHNDGSVWLDSLGWPWPKHPCFDAQGIGYTPPEIAYTSACKKCDVGIVFRCIDGECTPRHISGIYHKRHPDLKGVWHNPDPESKPKCGHSCLSAISGQKHPCFQKGIKPIFRLKPQQVMATAPRKESITPEHAKQLSRRSLEMNWIAAHKADDRTNCDVIEVEQRRRSSHPRSKTC
jgi:hypothetical protein